MTNKTFALSVFCSLAVHSALAVAVWQPWSDSSQDNTLQISYIKYPEQKPPAITLPPPVQPKQVATPPPRPISERAAQRRQARKAQVPVKPKPVIQTPATQPMSANDALKEVPAEIRSSADLLSDPKSKEVFESYFVLIKDRIHQVVRRKYSRAEVGEGQVGLVFILRSDGKLENVWTIEKMSTADILVKNFARSCVRDAAPFPQFPRELGMNRISFNITIIFDEL